MLMASRPVQQLQLRLKDASITLELAKIFFFVSQRLGKLFEGRNPDLKLTLHSIICDRSAGLFLYARLLLDSLISALVPKQHLDFEEIASTLPVGMQEMYNSILLHQSKSIGIGTDLQVFILNTVIFSSRLLLLNEIADLLAFVYPPYNLSNAKTIIKSACVIHHSFTEFLLESNRAQYNLSVSFPQFPVLNQKSAHKSLVLNCLAYTQSGTLTNPVHILNDISRVGCPRCNRGHDECCCDWSKDTGGRTLLHWAFQRGHFRIVGFLLQHRAILDDEDYSHLRPIHKAARRNFAPIVLVLLKAGVNPTRSTDDKSRHDSEVYSRNRKGESGTALDYMCANGHTETILVTVPFLDTRGVEEALWRCLINGKSKAAQDILPRLTSQ
ncbi:hypothetical protein EAF00_008600 [Botryotinia globosa]|nr:hypothetical protein EAF00_008600 [Botryotinia globosa]